MKITVIRHGETDWNAVGKIQGKTDIPLNTNGREQARITARLLSKHNIDVIISSPLKRAVETAEIISNMFTLPKYRRNGIAKKLLKLCVDEAKVRDCGSIHITASEMGAKLYEDFGFERNSNFFQYRL